MPTSKKSASKTKTKKKMGRPSKYKADYCEKIIEHCSSGLSFESFAGLIKVNPDTIQEWAKVHADFSVAKRIAQACSRLFWERKILSSLYISGDKEAEKPNNAMIIYASKAICKMFDQPSVLLKNDGELTFAIEEEILKKFKKEF